MSQISLKLKIILILGMMISGSTETIFSNFQNSQYFYQGSFYKTFYHPYCQATMMFFAMFLSLPCHYLLKKKYPQTYKLREEQSIRKGLEPKINVFYLALPAFLDGCSSTFLYIALNFLPPSVHQMIRGGSIVMTFILSIVFLKIKIQKYKITGALMAFIGILIVGASNVIFNDEEEQNSKNISQQIFGYVFIILSMFFQGFLLVFQQKLFQKYHLQTLHMVGTQGMFGVLIYSIILPILTFLPCPFNNSACVFSQRCKPYFQRPQQWIKQIFSNSFLLSCVIGSFTMVFFYNIAGNSITKYINAISRAIVNISGTVFVWIFGLILTVTAGQKYPNYQWQIVGYGVILLQLFGFLLLIAGNMIYNKIFTLSFFNYQNKQNQKSSMSSYIKVQNQKSSFQILGK